MIPIHIPSIHPSLLCGVFGGCLLFVHHGPLSPFPKQARLMDVIKKHIYHSGGQTRTLLLILHE